MNSHKRVVCQSHRRCVSIQNDLGCEPMLDDFQYLTYQVFLPQGLVRQRLKCARFTFASIVLPHE